MEIKEDSLEHQIKINLNDNDNKIYNKSPKLKSKFFQNTNKEETGNINQTKIWKLNTKIKLRKKKKE